MFLVTAHGKTSGSDHVLKMFLVTVHGQTRGSDHVP